MLKRKLTIAAIVAAATVGEGVFAIPYVIENSGWLVSLGYFVAIVAIVSVAHIVYLRTLSAVGEKERLLGLARKYFGGTGFWIGFLAIVVGLLLSFIAFLVLGSEFLRIIFPWLSASASLGVFWLFLAFIIWRSEGRIASLETVGVSAVTVAIFFIFFSGHPFSAITDVPAFVPRNFFLPFGVILFSLAGWTCVEPIYELVIGGRRAIADEPVFEAFWLFAAGTAFAGLLYWFFAGGVIGTTPQVGIDMVASTAMWPAWRRDILAAVGLLAMSVVSLPIAREIRGAMEKDLRWHSSLSRALIIMIPLAAVLLGFNSFVEVVGLAGGLFIAVQYLLILSVGRRTLALARSEKLLLDIVAFVFLAAAVYEVWYFVV
jgi:amino acid permease